MPSMRQACPDTRTMRRARRWRAGFTLIDVLVSIIVIGILISLLMPGLARVSAHSRRVACSSNLRQIGLGLAMYADDFRGSLPPSIHLQPQNSSFSGGSELQEMMELRLDDPAQGFHGDSWDGLGLLFETDYLNGPKLFYCPSHRGNHPFSRYSSRFGDFRGGIVSNYHFRGIGPNGSHNLYMIEPSESALVADGMATKLDYNHRVGINILRADQVVEWFDDPMQLLANSLPDDEGATGSSSAVQAAWKTLDGHNGSSSDNSDNGGAGR